MSRLVWTIDEGLHEMDEGGLRTEALRLRESAERAWNKLRRLKMLEEAGKMLNEADRLGNDYAIDEDEKNESDWAIRTIEDPKTDPYRRDVMIDQARRKWGRNWEEDRMKKVAAEFARPRPVYTWSNPDGLADGIDSNGLIGNPNTDIKPIRDDDDDDTCSETDWRIPPPD